MKIFEKSDPKKSVTGMWIQIVIASFALVFASPVVSSPLHPLDLSGEWELSLGSQSDYDKTIQLPSTLDEAGIGEPNTMGTEMTREVMLHLQRKYDFVGEAWYRKKIDVPEIGENTKAILKMERVLWKSTIYLNGKKVSEAKSLATPHEHDLTEYLVPGEHELVICIDNTRQHRLNSKGMAHAYTNETQIKWNGVLGDFEIQFLEMPELAVSQINADLASRTVTIETSASLPAGTALEFAIENPDGDMEVSELFSSSADGRYELQMPGKVSAWSEFSPALYTLSTRLVRDGETVQKHSEQFGFREIGRDGKVLTLNGEPIFLRGTLECSIFPLTGHPPLEKEGWLKVYHAAKSYGLNHIRFHSWCPPKAAFEAADEVGIYLQVEPPNWSVTFGEDEATAQFIESEAKRIIEAYGNHPSFCFMSMGNELEGDFERLRNLVTTLKAEDPRHLYATTAYTFQKGHGRAPEPVDDFFITQYTDKGWVRGQGVFDSEYPNFETDYSDAVSHLDVPLVTHEIGQYSVFPNMEEIEKYTGVLEPKNFKAVERDLREKGLLHLADDYLKASGQLAKILYKEEIERALKTQGVSGFQLLDLHDFPGQGTALVGLLDAFWDSKGIVSPEAFRTFCSPVVPLVWMEKAVYRNSETVDFEYGFANYLEPFKNQTLTLELTDQKGNVIQKVDTRVAEVPAGQTEKLGSLEFSLSEVDAPSRLTLTLSLSGTEYRNSWELWVYPDHEAVEAEADLLVTRSFSEAMGALNDGGKVLLNPEVQALNGLEGKFVQVFWSPVHFPDQPGTMGLLVDPNHDAFQGFPTDFHSNWQWWDLCKTSKTLEFGELPIEPLVRVVDNFFKNRNLATLFEAKVGEGTLLFSSMDVMANLDTRPAADQLRRSLEAYMRSESFAPDAVLTSEELERFISQ